MKPLALTTDINANGCNPLRRTVVLMCNTTSHCLEFSAEGLVQQRLLQLGQRGELLLIDGFEALGFGYEGVEFGNNVLLFCQ